MNHTSFFDKVTFDQKLLHTTHAKYLLNFRLVLLLIVMLVILGSYSFLTLPRRLNPEIKIPIITVATVLPGSSPSDIESLVCEPLERSIKSLKGIDTYSSTSQESLCILAVQFKSGIDTEKAKDEVQSTVDQVQLPEDAQKPTVKKLDFEDQPVWVFSLHGDTDYASLQRFSSKLKDALIESVYTDRVTTLGDDKTQIEIRIRPEVSNSLGIHAGILRDAITAGLGTYPAGTVYTQNNQFTVSTPKKIKSVSDITQIGITIKGVPFKIGDIAEVGLVPLRDSKRSLSASPHEHPSESILFYVYKTSASDITVADTTFRNIVAKQMESYPRLSFYTIDSNAEQISNQFTELLDEFVSAIILVVIVIAVFLGIKQALLSSLTFPLTFLSAFALMRIAGLSIDFISLFGFLIALGLLIDDTIVTVTAMTRYHQTGKFTGKEVGLLVWRDFIVPLWSTTITTIWAFVPLLLSSGIIGEFIKPIPLVVTFNMISSTAIAVLITIPTLMRIFDAHIPRRVVILLRVLLMIAYIAILFIAIPSGPLKLITVLFALICGLFCWYLWPHVYTYIQSKSTHPYLQRLIHIFSHGVINLEVIAHRYKRTIQTIITHQSLRRQVLGGIIIFAAVGFALIPLGLVKNEFFPRGDSRSLYVSVDSGASTRHEVQQALSKPLLELVTQIDGVEFASSTTNTTIDQNGGVITKQGSSLISIRLHEKEKRSQTSYEIADILRKKLEMRSDARYTVIEQSGGPPAGADVVVKYLGNDLGILDEMADKTVAHLQSKSYIQSVEKSLLPAASRIVFVPDVIKMTHAKVHEQQVGFAIRTAIAGVPLGKLKIQDEEKEIVFTSSHDPTPTNIFAITIQGPDGALPLTSLGEFRLEPNPAQIKREGGKRVVAVHARVSTDASVSDANKEALDFANTQIIYPPGYKLDTGGVNEENQKSVTSIIQAMGLAFLLIFVTMVIEFRSFRLAVLTLLCVPLAVAAVLFVFGMLGIPLSFPSLIGILALFGIVVTTAIVIVEKINENREHGMTIDEAIVEAAGSRLEPIILTSITTIVGLIPISASDPVWRGLGGAIISGLLFSGLLKLFFIPIIYKMWMREETKSV